MDLPDDGRLLFLHNPRCSKSRAVKALLDERGADYTERRYLEEPLTAEELAALEQRLGLPIAEWTRTSEAEFEAAGLEAGAPADDWRAAVAAHPVLMQRPIVVRGARARIGRPPEAVEELL